MDAVYHPACVNDERTFQQEGWCAHPCTHAHTHTLIPCHVINASLFLLLFRHYELDKADEAITYKGVVFNEMKGVYSSPDSVLGREVQQALFPDNTYGVDSGGDPTVIPQLTFAQFQDFHARYYHPSNSRLWFYGDDDAEKRLEILDAYLSEFTVRPCFWRCFAPVFEGGLMWAHHCADTQCVCVFLCPLGAHGG